jgi:hypothetical protein
MTVRFGELTFPGNLGVTFSDDILPPDDCP